MTQEQQRLQQDLQFAASQKPGSQTPAGAGKPWKKWGPYLSERQWGTVREDYQYFDNPTLFDDAWGDFPFHIAHARAYRWGEDGIAGISDDRQQLCFAIALWNGKDTFNRSYWVYGSSEPKTDAPFPLLKERLFGLTGNQGNHGEDVKEYYYYLDNTPTHSWMRYLYKYPQSEFPYFELIDTARERNTQPGRGGPEHELLDTGAFAGDRYFDVFVEYAKADAEDILIQIRIENCGPESSPLHLLPTLWFRNTWSWDANPEAIPNRETFTLKAVGAGETFSTIAIRHPDAAIDKRWLYCDYLEGQPATLLFADNNSNPNSVDRFCDGLANPHSRYYKDGFNEYVTRGRKDAVNPENFGTKAAPYYHFEVAAGASVTVRLRLSATELADPFGSDFARICRTRQQEADAFYQSISPLSQMSADRQQVQRQAFAGLLWSKQYYLYDVDRWLEGDEPALPAPNTPQQRTADEPVRPGPRRGGRNTKWTHLDSRDILSMPDKWEYPWFAAWDLAFHTLPLALVDFEFAKNQLDLMTREWYMHPNGQIPAYEWNFSDVNPPVHAWATWRVFRIGQIYHQQTDRDFLERVFQKLMLNFTWWVNRKDADGNNLFEGGFLGLDNIGIFNRSEHLPTGGALEQADGTSWMAMFCLDMLKIALELAAYRNNVYEDIATKFFEHFISIAHTLSQSGSQTRSGLWDDEDGFFYDYLLLPEAGDVTLTANGRTYTSGRVPLKLRSMVGLIPLYATMTIEADLLERVPGFNERLQWFLQNRPELSKPLTGLTPGAGGRRLLSLVSRDRLQAILKRMLDETEFLSPYGIRALSKAHDRDPYTLHFERSATAEERQEDPQRTRIAGEYAVSYLPGESDNFDFGGNSNWRGPIWFPVNQLIIDSLWKFNDYYGESLTVPFPSATGTEEVSLGKAALRLSARLAKIFERDRAGRRAVFGDRDRLQTDPRWRDCIPFHEYFHGDTGTGVGASHQTGWTGAIAHLIHELHAPESRVEPH